MHVFFDSSQTSAWRKRIAPAVEELTHLERIGDPAEIEFAVNKKKLSSSIQA